MKSRVSPNNEVGVVERIDAVIDRAARAGASDIHFEPTEEALLIRYRVDGRLFDVERWPAAVAPNAVTRLKVMAGLLTYRTDIPQEGGLAWTAGRTFDLRVSSFPTIRGERVAVRLMAQSGGVRRIDQLGLSDPMVAALKDAVAGAGGLVLVTGPAGSGKTTTLYALVEHVRTRLAGVSLITLEDPVECRLDGVAQVQVAPHGELTYARALRSLLRQDPQVLLIGEIRDGETAQIVIEAALTGHLLLSSMHAGSAAEAIVRLREMGVPGFQLTSAVRLVTSQRLLRTICEACHMRGGKQRGSAAVSGERGGSIPDSETERCPTCLGSGYRGRTACGESTGMSTPLREAILARADTQALQTAIAAEPGHVGLAADARRHVESGLTTLEEVVATIRRF